MIWNKGDTTVILKQSDLKIMAQCRIPLDEILNRQRPNKNIPPLWSVLSYAMLQRNETAEGVWFYYRLLKAMAADTAQCYYRHHIPKANGGTREIFVPRIFLQREQKFILDTILSALPVDEHAFAYRQGVRMEDCAKPHLQKEVLIHLDLKNFFGSITENMVYEALLAETGYSKSLCRFFAKMCCFQGSLPQGTVTSPMLSNIVFRKCDVALAKLAEKYQLDYTRYSDDLFFSGSEDTNLGQFLKNAYMTLLSHGFRVNYKKTQVRKNQHRQAVLGLTVNDRLQVNRAYRRKLMQELYYHERFGKNSKGAVETGDYLKYMQQLQGKLAYVLHIDPENNRLWETYFRLTLQINQYRYLRDRGFVT